MDKQTERIHHRCRCLDRNFTFEEWVKYLREENPTNEPVLTVGDEFRFNVHDVCMTPHRPVRIEKPTCKLEVRTAQSLNGRWDYGIDLNMLTEGHHCGAGFIDDPEKGFPTEVQRQKQHYDPKQLSLFDI